jgi:hypothetical protein
MSSKDKVLPAAGPNQTYVEVSALNGGWVTLPEKVKYRILSSNHEMIFD